MRFSARLLLALLVLASPWVFTVPAAIAQESPVVRIVVPAPPGGNLDTTARALAQRLTVTTGETHVVENRSGANTVIGSEYVARAAPDGRVLLFNGSSVVLNAWLQKLSFSPLEDLQAVVQVSVAHYVLVVSSASGVASVQDLVARGERPVGLNCAAPPGPMAMACEQFKARLGGRVTTVPYPGISPAVTALVGGHVDLLFVNVEAVDSMIQAGRLRALAASSQQAGPAVPLFSQLWPGFLMEGFSGLFAPGRTPPEKVRQINRQVNLILSEPQFRAHMKETGQEPAGGSAEQFTQSVVTAHQRYGELIRKLDLGVR